MEFTELKEGILIGLILSFMIGPVFFVLLQTSILKGIKAALFFNVGVVLSDICFISIVYFGSRSLLEKVKNDPKLFFAGGLIMVVYGMITFFNNKKINAPTDELPIPLKSDYVSLMLKGFLLNFINVGVLGFWLGTLLIMGPRLNMEPRKIYTFFSVILISYFTVDLGKIVLAKKLKQYMTAKTISKTHKVIGVFLVVFGLILITKGFNI